MADWLSDGANSLILLDDSAVQTQKGNGGTTEPCSANGLQVFAVALVREDDYEIRMRGADRRCIL